MEAVVTPAGDPRDAARIRRRLLVLRLASVAPLVAGAAAWFWAPSFRDVMRRGFERLAAGDVEGLRVLGDELGAAAALFTSALMVVQAIAAPIPAVTVTAANSWLFGPFVGGCLSIASATVAALVCFALARAWGEPIVARLARREHREMAQRFLERHGAASVLAARLVPFVPFDPISFAAGLSPMRAWTFTWATFVGQIPAGMAYSYLAQEAGVTLEFASLAAATLLGLSLIAWSFRRAVRARDTARAP